MYPQMEHDACGIGSIVNIDGRQDRRVVDDATGQVGDGVGILTQIPHGFFCRVAQEAGITLRISGDLGRLPQERMARESAGCQAGDYGIGMFFLPQDNLKRTFAIRMFEVIAQKEGLEILGWRDVPVR